MLIGEEKAQEMHVADRERLKDYRERHVKGGKGHYHVAKDTPELEKDEKYGYVYETEESAREYRRREQEAQQAAQKKKEIRKNDRVGAGFVPSSEERKYIRRYLIRHGRSLSSPEVKKQYTGVSGIERAVRKGYIYKDSTGRVRRMKTVDYTEETEQFTGRIGIESKTYKDEHMSSAERMKKYRKFAKRVWGASIKQNANEQKQNSAAEQPEHDRTAKNQANQKADRRTVKTKKNAASGTEQRKTGKEPAGEAEDTTGGR